MAPTTVVRLAGIGALLGLLACATEEGTAPAPGDDAAPVVAVTIPTQVAVVGATYRFDATLGETAFTDPGGRGLSYAIAFSPDAPGLSAAGGTLLGVPATPGVVLVTLSATNRSGASAIQQFRMVIFAAGLPAPHLPDTRYPYADLRVPVPDYFWLGTTSSLAGIDNTPADNHTTDAGATLGRVLFYDTRLSGNDQVGCASCHQQALGFSDTARFSRGVNGSLTGRHAMALANNRFYQEGTYFWDERAPSLEAQVLQPIQDSGELGISLDDLVLKLGVTPYYPPLFEAAFGTPAVSADRVARALAQFVRSLLSTHSRFDSVFVSGGPPDYTRLTPQEQEGRDLFVGSAGCGACHHTNTQVNDAARNIGLDAARTDEGSGGGRFKAPSLRNVAVRGPYMHDGRFASLREVLTFYDTGVQPDPELDTRLRNPDGTPKRLNLTAAQLDALEAFMGALTDRAFLSDPRFSSPFAR